MTGRTQPEWIASHPDQAIPKSVKLRVWARCEGKCALTGRKLLVGDPHDFDHIVPLADGGRHAESNLQLVSREAHREKTAAEAGPRAKVRRMRLKHLGLWEPPVRKLKGRGFAPGRNKASELSKT